MIEFVDLALPALLGLLTAAGCVCWAITATTVRRPWMHVGTIACALLASSYWAEVIGLDHTTSVRTVRIVGAVWLAFACVAVPAWVARVARRQQRQAQAVLELVNA